MLTSYGRFNLRQTFTFVALLLVCALLVFPSLAASARSCECKDLDAIKVHLRNAIHLQKQFSDKIAGLKKAVRPGIARDEFKEFVKNLRVTPPAGETGPQSVTYEPRGDKVAPDRYGEEKGGDLCKRTEASEAQLRALERGLTCAELAPIFRAHEDSHVAECTRLGYPTYRSNLPALAAAEEAEAYRRQINALRTLIRKIEAKCKYKITTVSRWHVPGEANINIVANIHDAGMKAVGEGRYKGTASVKWTITIGQVVDCIPQSVTTSSQAELTGQVNDREEFKLDVNFLMANSSLPVYCVGSDGGIASGSTPVQLTPDPITVSIPAFGGARRLPQVLQWDGSSPGYVVVTVKQE